MNFCPECFNMLDYTKSSSPTQNITQIASVNDAIKIYENNTDFAYYRATFSKSELENNKKYLKYPKDAQNKFNVLFNNINITAEYKCNNCNFTKPINETIRLYTSNSEPITNKLMHSQDNELICNNPILPHTHDYNCKNIDCITHSQPELKDSIFYKDRLSYKIKYVCCVCKHNWSMHLLS